MVGVYGKEIMLCPICKTTHEVETGWESELPNKMEYTCNGKTISI
jgi:hypothetical protein